MVFDFVAGTRQAGAQQGRAALVARPLQVLVFDSGLGGLTVFPAVRESLPECRIVYAADDAVFPYGALAEGDLVSRVLAVMEALIGAHDPDIVVIACHTASTLVLPPLRSRWPSVAFVGTVPAIKPAAAASTSKRISVLATAGTVKREYTRALVDTYAADCAVTLVGAPRLASLAEAVMRGEPVADEAIAESIAPAFVVDRGLRTDVVVLACTHYPLLLPQLRFLAPWPVTWIDPAAAIARRVVQVASDRGCSGASGGVEGLATAAFTSNNAPGPALGAFLARCGLQWQTSPALAALGRSGRAA